jgi:hypothetical protein
VAKPGIVIDLDLLRLESPARFQAICSRLARREHPGTVGMAFASWDGGRDIVLLAGWRDKKLVHEVVWQAKFTARLDSTTKKSIAESVATLRIRRGEGLRPTS